MARSRYAGRLGDTVASLFSLGRRQVLTLPVDANGDPTTITLTVWDAPGGTQLTDLRAANGTTPITQVAVPATGEIPLFYGPDGYNVEIWVRDPEGDHFRLDASNLDQATAAIGAATNATTAAGAAAASADDASSALADIVALQGTAGLALDTDGQPYFDPALAGTTPTLALLSDTDGTPYIVGA